MILDNAIRNLYPNVVTIDGEVPYDSNGILVSIDNNLVNQEVERLTAEFNSKQYQRDRLNPYNGGYPKIQDQLDTLFHGGYDAWKAQIQAVKDKYPKVK